MPLLGLWLQPADPFFLDSGFPWVVLGTILPALRYGFSHGFVSALVLIGLLLWAWKSQRLGTPDFPQTFALGLLVLGMLVGEFTDAYRRRIGQHRIINEHQRNRLDEFTRNYHLLRVSHDRLEQRLAASSHSLRGALLELRQRLEAHAGAPLQDNARNILDLFADFGWLQVASLHAVQGEHLCIPPLATLGEPAPVDPLAPMVRHTLKQRELLSIREEFLARQTDPGPLLATIPVIDVNDRLWALILVQEMPFIALHEDNLRLLAVLGGHLGDLLSASADLQGQENLDAARFRRQLARALQDARRYRLPALLATLRFPEDDPGADEKIDFFLAQLRGLDHPWRPRVAAGPVLFLLMPLTTESDFAAYRARMDRQLRELYGQDLDGLGIRISVQPLGRRDRLDDLLARLHETAGIASHADPR